MDKEVIKAKIEELEEKLKACQKEGYKQLQEENFMEKLVKQINTMQNEGKAPKYIVADFIGRSKLQCMLREYMRGETLFSEREGITFRGLKVINVEECVLVLEEEEK